MSCTVTIDISRCSGEIKSEWEALRDRDVVFLVSIQAPQVNAVLQILEAEKKKSTGSGGGGVDDSIDDQSSSSIDYVSLLGIKYVRGGEVFEMQDEANVVLNDPSK